jgi:hypothetical protein
MLHLNQIVAEALCSGEHRDKQARNEWIENVMTIEEA